MLITPIAVLCLQHLTTVSKACFAHVTTALFFKFINTNKLQSPLVIKLKHESVFGVQELCMFSACLINVQGFFVHNVTFLEVCNVK